MVLVEGSIPSTLIAVNHHPFLEIPMVVYLLSRHEKYEGHTNLNVTSSVVKAQTLAQEDHTSRSEYRIESDDVTGLTPSTLQWGLAGDDSLVADAVWSDIYDDWATWYEIQTWEVED